MKTVTLAEMQTIAEINGGKLGKNSDNGFPAIVFTFPMFSGPEDYGIEATEKYEEEYCGFQFFGPVRYQERNHIIKTFEALTVPAIIGDLLTIERAKELTGRKIEVSYHDSNEGTERFKIVGMEEAPSQSIGQTKAFTLLTIPIDEEGNEKSINGAKEFYLNGIKKHIDSRDFIVDGKYVNVKSAGSKKDLANVAFLKYIKKEGIETKDGRTIEEIKCYPCDINTGWWNVAWILLTGGEKIKISYSGKEIWELFNAKNPHWVETGSTECEGFEVKQQTTESWCYEWQGIFRRGSGAERLFIEKILD